MPSIRASHSLLTPVSLAVRDAVVQPSIWKRTHGSGAGMVEAKPNGATALRRQLSIRAPDRPGLIRDVSLSLVADKVDLETVVARASAAVPRELLRLPFLRPVYDDVDFVVRGIWRRYAGWWDGAPHSLKPPRTDALAREVVALAGVDALLTRVRVCDDLAVAAVLAEYLCRARPDDQRVLAARRRIYERRAREEPSTMARGVFTSAARL